MFSTSTETRKNTWPYILNTTREARKKRKNTCLYALNISMVVLIAPMVFAFAMPAGAGFIVLLLVNGRIAEWAKLIPEWMQFIEIKEVKMLSQMTPEINFLFYASLFFAIAITVLTACMLYQMQKNSEKRGENKCQLKILESLNQEKKQTITHLDSNSPGEDEKKEVCVALKQEYRNGCIIKNRDKTARLEYNTFGRNRDHEYEVVECEDIENFEKDFCGEENSEKVTIYGFKPHSNVLSTLSDVIFKARSKEEEVESPRAP